MEHRLEIDILAQVDLTTCGPTCLQAVYSFFGDDQPLEVVNARVASMDGGGTLAVLLAIDALERGYRARLHTFNLRVFDPTWLIEPGVDLRAKLREQAVAKADDGRLTHATEGYLRFLDLGGEIVWRDLTPAVLAEDLKAGRPILTGLSATYMYQEARERPEDNVVDDIAGESSGHFVVLCGMDPSSGQVLVADPLASHPLGARQTYSVSAERVICAILLGVLTYDANLLVLEPPDRP